MNNVTNKGIEINLAVFYLKHTPFGGFQCVLPAWSFKFVNSCNSLIATNKCLCLQLMCFKKLNSIDVIFNSITDKIIHDIFTS